MTSLARIFISLPLQAPDPAAVREMVERAARLAGLPEPMLVTLLREEWPPQQDGWRVTLILGERVVSVLLPSGELSLEKLALTLRQMAAGDPVP